MKILTVVGARPQFIKAAVVSREIADRPGITEIIVHTGQHYDAEMSEIFFEQMHIPKPHYNLAIGGGKHGEMTGRQLEKIEGVLLKEAPDWVLVYGDTNSTLAGALASAKLNIPVAHVEAGLRSFNRKMPEEINRILTDHASTLLFAPTDTAVQNLENEGRPPQSIRRVGDVMLDATLFYAPKAVEPPWFRQMTLTPQKYVLCTIHRAENTDDIGRLVSILEGLARSPLPIILPLHPRTKQVLAKANLNLPSTVRLVPPVGYLEMAWLEKNCASIVTDSGGVQKEAYFHNKLCITIRDETEWTELVTAGVNILVGTAPDRIEAALKSPSPEIYPFGLYGDGHAASKIVEALL
ncbi:non-hydrolyzing UDP-N-acetylglucosamine 2-epimerase [Pigmentiphaga kullae]|uniref:UDP-GlcNAc3NAcA epimerase n=1 Tax=Pigmentiphaga kullae TaxID=151784 RepID=A0A4Q7NLN4_9BURK|nr:UDP-N-acetylglucosamine 2-epimerase (non-hydrolyzing) [Pigmentiphaga kullae]RZS85973.1 UDP-GlcNAc3NAcA epimerase [Pigmentiphaga kullae]